MAEADGSVVIPVEMNISDAEKQLSKLKKEIFNLEDDIAKKTHTRDSIASQLKEVEAAYKKIHETGKRDESGQLFGEDAVEAERLYNEAQKLTAQIEKYDAAIEQSKIALDATASRYGEIERYASRVPKAWADMTKASDLVKMAFEKIKNSASLALTAIRHPLQAIDRLLGALANGIKSAFSKGAQLVKNFGKALGNAAKGIVSAASKLNVFSKLTASIGPKLSRLGSMVKRVFVFSVITAGLRALRSQLSSYLESNTEFQNALGRLKGAFMTAFQPIYDHVMPALTSLVNGLTKAIAVIAQFVSALFGTTAKDAQANAKALNAQAKATAAAGGAAEDAEKSLASFDEINKLSGGSKGGSGGGGASAEAADVPTFDLELDDTVFKSWGEAFDNFLDHIIKEGLPALQAGLTTFGKNINNFSGNLLEMFTFPGVYEKVVGLGASLATAFNGLVNQINWLQLGQAFGEGLKTAIGFLVSLITTFDWMSLGGGLANSINGIVSAINWTDVGTLLSSGFTIAVETLAGFILGLNVPELSKAATNLMTGFFDSLDKTIKKIDWKKLGKQVSDFIIGIDWAGVAESASNLVTDFFNSLTDFIAAIDWFGLGQQVKDFLVNINWSSIVTSLFTTIGAAFGAAAAFLWGLIKDAWQAVIDWWHEKAFEDGEFTLTGLLNGILEVIKNIGTWINDNIFKPFINGFKRVFGINSPSTVMAEQGGFIMDGLLGGLKDKLQPILDFFTGIYENIKNVLGDVITFITSVFKGDWSAAWDAIKQVFKDVWNGVISFLEGGINLIIDGINWLISQLNKVSWDVPDWVPIIGGKKIGISIPPVSKVSIPRLAQGAVIPPNREFMAVLGDQKSGTNIETPLDTMVQAFRQALSQGGYGGSGDTTIILEVDGQQFGKVVYNANRRESKRIGVRLAEV